MISKTILKSFLFCSIFTWTATSEAYIPPSFYVVRMLAKKHSSVKNGVVIKHKLSFFKKNGDTDQVFTETIFIKENQDVTIQVQEQDQSLLYIFKRSLEDNLKLRPLLYDLLFLSDGTKVFNYFKKLGLPLKTEKELQTEKMEGQNYVIEKFLSLSRIENRIAITINKNDAVASLLPTPSLWIEKDSFLPLKAAWDQFEFQFSSYYVYENGFLYPRNIHVLKNNTLWFKLETIELTLKKSMDSIKIPENNQDSFSEPFDLYFKWIR